ncbi:ATP phosphoribosyltransferase regulatory subunit [Anaeromicropila populeti]|uniref:Histidyl-tRNA synthetase n=1 Tax=Anaeromicropila populeti TaxID=37658 RepID=A0A1I6K9L0_9FIRM|nr:ATP phosphoribosyltransferase regulatory subunit [Anaeromicropila populeti]SFR87877.1 Histidyl-tRNA synthetase [Anaeromicropila populeti]
MLIAGVKEWYGNDAQIFLKVRNRIEESLLTQGFNYFYGGMVSKKSIYEEHVDRLGERFMENCIEFTLNGKNEGIIISPESTFRVYDFLKRNNKLENNSGQIFYSQEFMRNESEKDIQKGKTFSFWQTGYEIYGKPEIESSTLALVTAFNCFATLDLPDTLFRISDKRILEGMIDDYTLNERRDIYYIIDCCGEDGEKFYNDFVAKGGNKATGEKVKDLLDLEKYEPITLEKLDVIANNKKSHSGIEFLSKVADELRSEERRGKYTFVPFIAKSWDACDSLLFDARLPEYNYAVAGGGNLHAFNDSDGKKVYKSGAGIGVTRLAEYIIEHKIMS